MNSSLFRLRSRELARASQRPRATDEVHVDVEAVVDGRRFAHRRGFGVGQKRSGPRDEVLFLLRDHHGGRRTVRRLSTALVGVSARRSAASRSNASSAAAAGSTVAYGSSVPAAAA